MPLNKETEPNLFTGVIFKLIKAVNDERGSGN